MVTLLMLSCHRLDMALTSGTLETHCAYAQRTDGMFSDNQIRELLIKNL